MNEVDINYNKLLLKQIQKKFGNMEDLPPEMLELLNTVSHTYDFYEKERQLIERSMDLSSNELMEANNKLNQQALKLQRSNQELREFSFAVSHDLKEPLRTIASYIQLTELRLKDKLDDETKEFMMFAVSGVKRLQVMLGEMLKYAQASDEQKDFSKITLRLVIETAIENLHESITQTGTLIKYAQLPEVSANRFQLIQLFQNLFSNSIKFRSAEKPLIEIKYTTRDKDYLFSVIDNGIGAPDKDKQQLFTMFKRGHTTEYDGIGMGLAICKKIVESHGGTIWIEETTSPGLRVDFTLPKITG